jgi:hypothetical protein
MYEGLSKQARELKQSFQSISRCQRTMQAPLPSIGPFYARDPTYHQQNLVIDIPQKGVPSDGKEPRKFGDAGDAFVLPSLTWWNIIQLMM